MISKVLKYLTPFRIILGICCLGVSIIIVFSILISNIDRLINSKCGFSCGYVLDKNTLFNPLDSLFVQLSKIFPLDLIFLGLILLYVFISSLFGLIRLGIRFPCLLDVRHTYLTINYITIVAHYHSSRNLPADPHACRFSCRSDDVFFLL